MDTAQKIRLLSILIATVGFTWALAEIGMFSRAAFQQSPNLYLVYALMYVGIVGVIVSMLWKK